MDRDTSSHAASTSACPSLAFLAQQQGKAWGARSIVASANSSPRAAHPHPRYDGEKADADADDWVFGLDFDRMWHELRASNTDGMKWKRWWWWWWWAEMSDMTARMVVDGGAEMVSRGCNLGYFRVKVFSDSDAHSVSLCISFACFIWHFT